MRLPHDMVVVVADGSHVPLPKNHGDQARPDLRVIGHRQMENPPNCELLWGAPGLGFASGYPSRNTFSKSDPHQGNEARFVAEVDRDIVKHPVEKMARLPSAYEVIVRP